MNVAVVGCGYVGTVTAACLASFGHTVHALEREPSLVALLTNGAPPFHEPGLAGLLDASNLMFTTDPAAALEGAQIVFICVGTPSGAEGRPDIRQLASAAAAMVPHLSPDTVVVTKSTVPVGSGDWLAMQLEPARAGGWRGAIVSNPEFLREGSAVEDFLHPDRVVLGGEPEHVAVVESLYTGTTASAAAMFRMDRASAELVKYGANAALAAKISFANELADLCERTGADARLVLPAVGADPRIGPAFLEPGLGWGGSCLPKDVSALVATGAETGYDMALLRAAADVNDRRIEEVAQKLRSGLIRLAGRRVAVLGVAFKAGTSDTRDSPSIALIERLQRAGASVLAFDPLVQDAADLPLTKDAMSALADADAIVVATRDPAFERLDPSVATRAMRGRLVVDAAGVLPAEAFAEAGFQVIGAGWAQEPASALARTA